MLGQGSYSGPDVPEGVEVGNYTSIAKGCRFIILQFNGHKYDRVTTYTRCRLDGFKRQPDDHAEPEKKRILIGSDVHIGAEVVLRGGAEIGDGAVIGAHSVVRGTIPPYAVAMGNPCSIVKYRFGPEQIEALLKIAWWEWPHKKVVAAFDCDLASRDIDGFIEKYG